MKPGLVDRTPGRRPLNDSDHAILSRRAMLRGSALVGAGAALGSLPLAGGTALAAARVAAVDADWPTVTALIERHVASRKVSGMIAALGWGDKAPGYIRRGREGFDDRDVAGPDSLFRAYSMTKPVTGMMAMILIDEGKLGLDQPLADFAPEFARMQVALDPAKSLESRPATTLITVRHMLTHTAGFGYAVIGRNKVADELTRLGVNPGRVSRTPVPGFIGGAPTPEADEFLRRAATVPLVAEPGTRWSYSMALDVLGIILARAAGAKSFEALVTDRIFAPAGMKSSFFHVAGKDARRLTTNYALVGGVPLPIDRPATSVYRDPPPFAYGGSGLVTSPADYDRFLEMIVNKGVAGTRRVMSAAAVAMGTSNLLPDGADTANTFIAGNRFGAGGIVGSGVNAGLYGWSGAAGTIGYAQTRLGLRSGLYVQYMPSDQIPVLREFPAAIGKDLAARGMGA